MSLACAWRRSWQALSLGSALWLAACAGSQQRQPIHLLIFEEAPATLPASHAQAVHVPALGRALTISRYAALTDVNIRHVELIEHDDRPALRVTYDFHGQMLLDELTTRMRGRRVVIFLRDRPVAAPVVRERISDGVLIVTGEFTRAEAEAAVRWLNREARRRQAQFAPY